jgi:hypothetical protein
LSYIKTLAPLLGYGHIGLRSIHIKTSTQSHLRSASSAPTDASRQKKRLADGFGRRRRTKRWAAKAI